MSRTGLWDSHAHLDSDYFTDDRDELIAKIGEEMEGFINPGCDEASSAFAVQLAESMILFMPLWAGTRKNLPVLRTGIILINWQRGLCIQKLRQSAK